MVPVVPVLPLAVLRPSTSAAPSTLFEIERFTSVSLATTAAKFVLAVPEPLLKSVPSVIVTPLW